VSRTPLGSLSLMEKEMPRFFRVYSRLKNNPHL